MKEELQEIRCEAENLQLSQREKTTGELYVSWCFSHVPHLVNLGHMEGRIDKTSTVTVTALILSATSEDRFAARVTCNMLYRASQRLVASGSVIFRSPLRHVDHVERDFA